MSLNYQSLNAKYDLKAKTIIQPRAEIGLETELHKDLTLLLEARILPLLSSIGA